ncbi:MAG TPA: M14 family metallopeptidase [Gammaproteobacteria bacterium]|nr:M14 family metallopeptidase [Gammaproteobacteria bacterium]
MLRVLDQVPEGLLQARAEELEGLLGGPTLIHLEGSIPEPLFVSTLLHGNEHSGLQAVQALLRRHAGGRQLPRSLSWFVGNVAAARYHLRRLDGQPDYNRVWPGTEESGSPEAAMMARIVEDMRARRVFASVDIHNNTGLNPHYACVNRVDHRFLRLATLFSRTVVYFLRPLGVQSMALAGLCPAVTVECGKSDHAFGAEHAEQFLDACLRLHELPDHPVPDHDLDLFHTVATVKVPSRLSFGFDATDHDIRFNSDLDHLNFRELPAGTSLGRVRDADGVGLEAWDEEGIEVGKRFFRIDDGEIRTMRALMPSMFTLDERVIRQDCLGYVMERYPLAGHPGSA